MMVYTGANLFELQVNIRCSKWCECIWGEGIYLIGSAVIFLGSGCTNSVDRCEGTYPVNGGVRMFVAMVDSQ